MGSYLYLIGGALLILAVLLGRFRGGNALRARDVSGNVIVGDVSGSVTQTSTSSGDKGKPAPDRVAWVVVIVGVLVALTHLAQDLVA